MLLTNLRAISPLLIGVGLLLMGNGALNTLVPLRISASDTAEWIPGIVVSAYFLGAICGPFFIYRCVESIGHIRSFATFVALTSVTALVYPFTDSPWLWTLLRFSNGICTLCILTCTESWINERIDNSRRGQVLSIYVIVNFLALGSGQFLLSIPDEAGGQTIFALVSILFSLSAIPVLATRIPQPVLPEPSAFNLRRLYQISPLGVLGTLIFGLVYGAFFGLGAVYATKAGLSGHDTILFMASAYIGGLFLQWPAGLISDRVGRRPVLIFLAVGIVLISLSPLLIDHRQFPGLTWLLPILFGAFTFSTYPICLAHVNDYIPAEHLVKASGSLLVVSYLGNGLGSLGAAAVMFIIGHQGLFVFCLASSAVMIAVIVWRMRHRPITPAAGDTVFQPSLRSSVSVSEIDPRAGSAPQRIEPAPHHPDDTPAD